MTKVIEESILRTTRTDNDDINKPFIYFIMNSLVFLPPLILSFKENVTVFKFRISWEEVSY